MSVPIEDITGVIENMRFAVNMDGRIITAKAPA